MSQKGLYMIVLSCPLLLVFSRLKCHISVPQSPKYTWLKRITNQLSFVYTIAKSLYILLSMSFLIGCKSYYIAVYANLWVVSTMIIKSFSLPSLHTCSPSLNMSMTIKSPSLQYLFSSLSFHIGEKFIKNYWIAFKVGPN